MICRTSGLRAPPPLITITRLSHPVRLEGIDDVGETIGQPAQSRDEQPLHRVDIGVEIEARDHGARIRIGIGRAVAEKFRQHMNVAREPRRFARCRRSRDTMRCSRNCRTSRPAPRAAASASAWAGCDRIRWSIAAPAADWPPSFSQKPGTMPEMIGTPHARHEAGLDRRRHDAGRRSHDVGQPFADIDRLAVAIRPPIVPMPPACASISEARDRRARAKPKFRGCVCRSGRGRAACPAPRSRCRSSRSRRRRNRQGRCARNSCRSSAASWARKFHLQVTVHTERAERSGGAERQEVGEIEEMARARRSSRADAASARGFSGSPFPARSSRRHSAARRPGCR